MSEKTNKATVNGPTADETAEVRPVVRPAEDKTEDEEGDRPRFRLISNNAAAGSPAVIDQSAKQPENRRGGSHRETCAAQDGNESPG